MSLCNCGSTLTYASSNEKGVQVWCSACGFGYENKPAWFRWLRSFVGGYYWGPCSRCNRPFGRDEPGAGASCVNGHIICPRCVLESNQ